MPTLYVVETAREEAASAMRRLREILPPEIEKNGIDCIPAEPGQDKTEENYPESLLLRLASAGEAHDAHAGWVRYGAEYAQSARLAQQIAAHLQEFCPRFVEAAPLEKSGSAAMPTVQLEIAEEQPWFAEHVCSVARALAQAVDTYFAQTERAEKLQTATVDGDTAEQAIYARPTDCAPVVARTEDGTQLMVCGHADSWLHVRCGYTEGYVQKKFVTLNYPIK